MKEVTAFVLISVKLDGNAEKVVQILKKIDGIEEVHRIHGVYDIIVKVVAQLNKLKDIVTWNIRRIAGVTGTSVLIVA